MANPRGQQRDKQFRDALRLQLAAAGADQKALRKVADALITLAVGGDIQAIKELRDTLDGKPAQAIIGGDDDDPAIKAEITQTKRVIIDPRKGDTDSQGIPAASEPVKI